MLKESNIKVKTTKKLLFGLFLFFVSIVAKAEVISIEEYDSIFNSSAFGDVSLNNDYLYYANNSGERTAILNSKLNALKSTIDNKVNNKNLEYPEAGITVGYNLVNNRVASFYYVYDQSSGSFNTNLLYTDSDTYKEEDKAVVDSLIGNSLVDDIIVPDEDSEIFANEEAFRNKYVTYNNLYSKISGTGVTANISLVSSEKLSDTNRKVTAKAILSFNGVNYKIVNLQYNYTLLNSTLPIISLDPVKSNYVSTYNENEYVSNYGDIFDELRNQIINDLNLNLNEYGIDIYTEDGSIHDWVVVVNQDTKTVSKKFKVSYANSSNYNDKDKKVIDNIDDEIVIREEVKLGEEKKYNNVHYVKEQVTKKINKENVEIEYDGIGVGGSYLSGGLSGYTYVYVNGVLYKTISTSSLSITKFLIPYNAESPESYIINQVKEYLANNGNFYDGCVLIIKNNEIFVQDTDESLGEFIYELELKSDPKQEEPEQTPEPVNNNTNNNTNANTNKNTNTNKKKSSTKRTTTTKKTTTKQTTTNTEENTGTGKTEEPKKIIMFSFSNKAKEIRAKINNILDNILVAKEDSVQEEKKEEKPVQEGTKKEENKQEEPVEDIEKQPEEQKQDEEEQDEEMNKPASEILEQAKEENEDNEEKSINILYIVTIIAGGVIIVSIGVLIFLKGRY